MWAWGCANDAMKFLQCFFSVYGFLIYTCRCVVGCFLRQASFPSYDLSKLVKHEVQDLLSEALDDPGCGVFVHWGVEGSGKTAYASRLARELKEKGRSVLFLNYRSLSDKISAAAVQKFCEMLPDRERAFQMDPTKPPPTTIIVDDFDGTPAEDGHGTPAEDRLGDMIKSMAKASSTGRRFNVLLLVSSARRAQEILDWSWTHISLVGAPGCGIWRDSHIAQLFNMHPRLAADEDKEELLALCSRAGTPEFIVACSRAASRAPQGMAKLRKIADRSAMEWRDGIQTLGA